MQRHLRLTLSYGVAILMIVLGAGALISYQLRSTVHRQLDDLSLGARSTLEGGAILRAGADVVELAAASTDAGGRQAFERAAAGAIAIAADLRLQGASRAADALSADLLGLEQAARATGPGDGRSAEALATARARFESSLAAYTAAQRAQQHDIESLFTQQGPAAAYSIAAMLAVCATVVGLLYAFSRFLVTPLRLIGAALDAVGQGDLEYPLSERLPAEFAPIVGGYHAMRTVLHERQSALEIQLRRTSLLTQLSIELRETLDPAAIAERVLRVVGTNLNIDHASIILTPPDSPTWLGLSWSGGTLSPLDAQVVRRMFEQGLQGLVQHHGSSTVLADVSSAERWLAGGGPAQGSAIVLALSHAETSLGSLTVYAQQSSTFTNHDLLLMEGVVAQTGVALSLAQRFQAERRLRDQAIALLEVSQFLTIERSQADIASLIEEQSRSLFQAEHGLLYLQPVDGGPQLALASPLPGELGPHAQQMSASAAAEACARQQVVTASAGRSAAPYSAVALPLISAGKSLGACVLVQTRGVHNSFPAQTWSQLTIFSNLVAAACANMQLLAQMRQHAEQLEALVSRRTDELQRSRDLLRIVFDHLPEGLLLIDVPGVILAANNAFSRGIVGRTPRGLVGTPYLRLWRELAGQSELHLEPQGPSEGGVPMIPPDEAPISIEAGSWRVLSSDIVGQRRWYAVDRIPIPGPHGAAEQCLERWRDITHQEELQRRLLLHEQLTSLGRLAASVAHEVGNPLQSALGCLELCRESAQISDPAREYLDLALGELDRMARTMASLRNLYRPPQIAWEQVDLNTLMRQVAQFTQHQLKQSRVRLSLTLDSDLPPITGQPDALRQVFLNLLLNAQQAMAQGGEISITTERRPTDRVCRVTIRDTGVGMSEEQLIHIFEPFRSLKAQGVGLGLYLSQQIIEQHTGHIAIASQRGQGTSVTVQLPWSDAGPWRAPQQMRGEL